jgi:hypothetical protein
MSFDRRLRPYRRPVEWSAVLRDQFSCSRHDKLSRLARHFKSVDILTHEKVKAVLSPVLPSSESSFLYMKDTLGFSSLSFWGVWRRWWLWSTVGMLLTGKLNYSGGIACPSATLSTTNIIRSSQESNPGLRGKRPVIVVLMHEMYRSSVLVFHYYCVT